MPVTEIQFAITNEGYEYIINNIASSLPIKIKTFRIANNGDDTHYESLKNYLPLNDDAPPHPSTCSFYLEYTAQNFYTRSSSTIVNLISDGISDSSGYININTINKYSWNAMEIECYIPPTPSSAAFTINEMMIYTDSGVSFAYGVFPEINKNPQYGLNLSIIIPL